MRTRMGWELGSFCESINRRGSKISIGSLHGEWAEPVAGGGGERRWLGGGV